MSKLDTQLDPNFFQRWMIDKKFMIIIMIMSKVVANICQLELQAQWHPWGS